MQHLQPNTTLQSGKYRIERVLGQGGFGNTYIGINTVFNEQVAIKEFFMQGVTLRENDQVTVSISVPDNRDSFIEQKVKFKKEALRIRQLRNEHIVAVHDLFEENGTAYYVMDYVDGENLAERLKRTGKPMTEQEVRGILPQILDALKTVHDAGIWHLDLKPANIMLDKAGNVKLIDFGASKQLNAQKGGATTSTAISYTNGYAPREQMEQNYDKFGPWTDIYALGATLYNLLTNKRPPLPTDIDDDITVDKHEALPFPNSVSEETKALVLMMLNTNRLRRPQTIDSIIDAAKSGKTTSQHSFSQPTTSINTIDNDEEETLIATPHHIVKEEKAEPKAKPKVKYQQTTPFSGSSAHESNVRDGLSKNTIIFMVAAVIMVVCIFLNYSSCRNDSTQEQAPKAAEAAAADPVQTLTELVEKAKADGAKWTVDEWKDAFKTAMTTVAPLLKEIGEMTASLKTKEGEEVDTAKIAAFAEKMKEMQEKYAPFEEILDQFDSISKSYPNGKAVSEDKEFEAAMMKELGIPDL